MCRPVLIYVISVIVADWKAPSGAGVMLRRNGVYYLKGVVGSTLYGNVSSVAEHVDAVAILNKNDLLQWVRRTMRSFEEGG